MIDFAFELNLAPPTKTAQAKGERAVVDADGRAFVLHYKTAAIVRIERAYCEALRPHAPPAPLAGPLGVSFAYYFPATKEAAADMRRAGVAMRREAFAVAVAQGMTQADALRAAYPKAARWTSKAVYTRATRLAHLPEVAARIAELRRGAETVGNPGEGEAAGGGAVDEGREPVPAPAPAVEDADAVRRDRLARVLAWVQAQGVTSRQEARGVALQFDGGNMTGEEAEAVADAWTVARNARETP